MTLLFVNDTLIKFIDWLSERPSDDGAKMPHFTTAIPTETDEVGKKTPLSSRNDGEKTNDYVQMGENSDQHIVLHI